MGRICIVGKELCFMLSSLHAKNFAIIDEIEVDFGEHLNIISGETGAGKSVIIGSINAALGAKATKDIVRCGAEYALIELMFYTKEEAVRIKLEEMGLTAGEDGEILISRKITASGKSVFRINGETVNTATVRELAAELIDIHGQHEHQSLLRKAKHLEMLDRFAGEELEDLKQQIKQLYGEYRQLKEEKEAALMDEEKRLRELSFLQYELQEIEGARLVAGEEESLSREHKRLANSNMVQEALSAVYQLTEAGASAVSEQLGHAVRQLAKVEGLDDKLASLYSALEQAEGCIQDFNRELADYMENAGDKRERLAQVEERLNLVNHLTARYGRTVEEVLEYAENCRTKIEKYENYDKYLMDLEEKFQIKEAKLQEKSGQASAIRKEKAAELTKQLTEALKDLNFLDVKLEMQFKQLASYSAAGIDEAEFLISTNPGEMLQPLEKIASGGELSRIMLAMKSVFAGKDGIETMIFDEIDVGVSGRTAQMVSEKMAKISAKRQLLCITHLPQIAAMADTHFIIEKTTDGQTTKTSIHALAGQDAVKEIARMLGGVKITDKVIESAAEMKALASKKKELLGK